MRRPIPLHFIFLIVVIVVGLVGCEEMPEKKSGNTTQVVGSKAPTGIGTAYPGDVKSTAQGNIQGDLAYPATDLKILRIVKPDTSIVEFSLNDLLKLPKFKVTADGKTYEGIKVSDLLVQAKVANYSKLTITGAGSSLVVAKTDVDDSVLFTISNSITLISGRLKSEQWVANVTQVKID